MFEYNPPSKNSVLVYPGSKLRARKTIYQVTRSLGDVEIVSPFLGGGSFEVYAAYRGMHIIGGDCFDLLVDFWKCLLQCPKTLAHAIKRELNKIGYDPDLDDQSDETIEALRGMAWRCRHEDSMLMRAACFLIRNRTSFSGLMFKYTYNDRTIATRSRYGTADISESLIDRIKNFRTHITVDCADYRELMSKYPDHVVYCDPPYFGNRDQILYGSAGEFNQHFNHEELHSYLTKHRKKFVLSYDNHTTIKEMYSDFKIIELNWLYGMKKFRNINKNSELLIVSGMS